MDGLFQEMPTRRSEAEEMNMPLHCTFRHHLDALASEHVRLEEENRKLRSILLSLPAEAQAHHDVDSRVPCRVLEPDMMHAAAPPAPSSPAPQLHQSSPAQPEVDRLPMVIKDEETDCIGESLEVEANRQAGKKTDDADSAGSAAASASAGGENPFIPMDEWKRKPIFANADDMKERVRQQLIRHHYKEQEFYKKVGCAQVIARHWLFEGVTLVVIGLNALWIGIDTDNNDEDLLINAPVVFQVAEHLFCAYFCFEIAVRFIAMAEKWNCFKDAWFVFDLCLVLMMVLETWVMSIVLVATVSRTKTTQLGDASVLRITRLIRLTRMARMARLLRAMPELVILIKGIVAAARSVFFTLVLLCILLYVFGIACTQLLRGTDVGRDLFGSVLKSMHTLWLRATLLDEISQVMYEVEKVSLFSTVLLDLFILAAAMTVMNMLVGVLCEVVSIVSATEKEELNMNFVMTRLERICTTLGLDEDKNGMISKEEFVKLLENRDAALAIQDLGVDPVGLVDFADVFFATDSDDENYAKELSFAEFMEAVVALRGSNTATVKDLYFLRKIIIQQMTKNDKQVDWFTSTLIGENGGVSSDEVRKSLRISSKGRGSTCSNGHRNSISRFSEKSKSKSWTKDDEEESKDTAEYQLSKQQQVDQLRCLSCGKLSL